MADVNLPSFSDLGSMEFMSPMAFQQANKQMELANLFQQQNLRTGEEDFRTKQLANQFSEQANPLKINRLGMENEGLSSDNIIKGVEARMRSELAPEEIAAKRQKMLADMDENKLKQFMSRAEWEMNQEDPKLQASGLKKIMASKAEFDRRNKQADELQKIDKQGQNSKDVANIHAGATLGAARIGADSRMQARAASGKGDPASEGAFWGAFNKMGSAKARHAALISQAARFSDDPETSAKWMAMADQLRPQAEAEIASGRPPGIDMPQVANLPAAPGPNIAPRSNQPAPAQKPPGTLADVSKMYPGIPAEKLKEAYKKKFGVDLQ